jgi:hypothetical protein
MPLKDAEKSSPPLFPTFQTLYVALHGRIMRQNDYCSNGGGGATRKLVEESKTLKRLPWIDKKKAQKAVEASRRKARNAQ